MNSRTKVWLGGLIIGLVIGFIAGYAVYAMIIAYYLGIL